MACPREDQFEGDVISLDVYIDGKLIEAVLMQKGGHLDEEVCSGLSLPHGIRHFRFPEMIVGKYDGMRALRTVALRTVLAIILTVRRGAPSSSRREH